MRNVSVKMKKKIASKQYFKCANIPDSPFERAYNYKCLLWSHPERIGVFGPEGYEIDHIIEVSKSNNNKESNLQALCLSCHRIKTDDFGETGRSKQDKHSKVSSEKIKKA